MLSIVPEPFKPDTASGKGLLNEQGGVFSQRLTLPTAPPWAGGGGGGGYVMIFPYPKKTKMLSIKTTFYIDNFCYTFILVIAIFQSLIFLIQLFIFNIIKIPKQKSQLNEVQPIHLK